ncbi:MAG: DeoR/GlpR family DNA-binding transcription regulator [Actinomycetota bacterium]|nr:DeoR/GlpR family DNA-binding transcription regulator [Actinomycetota bacterium]
MRKGEAEKIPAQRRAEIRNLLSLRGAVSIAKVASYLSVSNSTARRDLAGLEKEGAVRRSHGGAVTVEHTTLEFRFKDRRRHHLAEKTRIGEYAVTLLEAGQSVIFDSSSTVLCAAEALGRRLFEVTAVTNDVKVASVLAEVPNISVVVPGGEIREGSFTLLGPLLENFLGGLHADVAFLGAHAISGDALSESSLSVVEAKRAMIGAARRVILLADHSKFCPPAFFEVARAGVVHDLVTDNVTIEADLEAMDASGRIRVHVV